MALVARCAVRSPKGCGAVQLQGSVALSMQFGKWRRRDEKALQNETEEFWQMVDEDEKAEAHADALEAAEEGDVSMFNRCAC